MEIEEPLRDLSKKTRGILFNLNKLLQLNKSTFQQIVERSFGFRKEKFRAKELGQLIKNIDQRLTYEDIDIMYNQLDPDGNGFIFFNDLNRRIAQVTTNDDPFSNKLDIESVYIMTKSRLARLSQQEQSVLALKELKDAMRNSDPYQLLDIFDEDRDGFLNIVEFKSMLLNINLIDNKTVELLMRKLFGNNIKVKFDSIMKAIGIEDIAKRVSFEEIPNRQSHIREQKPIAQKKIQPKVPKPIEQPKVLPRKVEPTVEPPKIQQPKLNVRVEQPKRDHHNLTSPKIKNDLPKPRQYGQKTPLKEIPSILEPYYNHSSELSQPLASIAMTHLLQKTTFFDKENPHTKKQCYYEHVLKIFGYDYYLFQVGGQSAIGRDRKGLGLMMEARNIIQGGVGDCYFMSAIAGVVEHYPELIYRLFVLDRNPASIYGIRLFVDGEWRTIITDACFPVNTFKHFIYAKPHNVQIWVMLLEKAWAKIYGSYDNIHAGFADEGLIALTGAPCEGLLSEWEGTIEKLKIYLKKGYIVSCSTSDLIGQMSEHQQQKMGIFSGHAYSLLKIDTDLTWKDRKITLVRVRNPWGSKEWKGDWSYNSNSWTNQLRERLNYKKNPNDGSFYMSLEDYMVYFSRITVCYVSLGKVHGHINLTSDRTHSVMVAFSIKTQGDFFFSLYQQNRRKYQQSTNYKLSKSRLFLGKVSKTKGKIESIASKACISENLHLQTTLTPGNYIISCKIRWNYHEKNNFVLASYGSEVVHFHEIPKNKQFLHSFVESKAEFELGEKQYYKKIGLPNAYKIVNMDPKQGFGYILIRNNSNKMFESQISFRKIHGIKPLKPLTLPLNLIVAPNTTIVRGFLVDPTGFGYEISEKTLISG